MRGTGRALAALLCLAALAACAERKTVRLPSAAEQTAPRPMPGTGDADRWRTLADDFMNAVRARDIGTLNRVRGREYSYDRNSRRDREFYALLYDGNYVRAYRKGGHSINEILGMGSMHAHIIDYDTARILIYFVPHAFIDDLAEPGFLRTQWLRKYFSCMFAWEAGKWRLADDCAANQISGRVARLD
jgi:hypothetical protein